MKVFFYGMTESEMSYIKKSNKTHLPLASTDKPLSEITGPLAHGYDCVVIAPSDIVSKQLIEHLHLNGVKYIVIRGSDYSNVDLQESGIMGIHVANVPSSSEGSMTEISDAIFYNILEWQSGLRPDNEITHEVHFISAGGNKR